MLEQHPALINKRLSPPNIQHYEQNATYSKHGLWQPTFGFEALLELPVALLCAHRKDDLLSVPPPVPTSAGLLSPANEHYATNCAPTNMFWACQL